MRSRFALLIVLCTCAHAHMSVWVQGSYQIAVLKYNGGGDWYANPTAVPNLVKF